eukprot:CAMPEP_0177386610 /NCGR_PEP_ID=MMETSP0368-20130122/50890_1 /TAXON_ID=447022 ORGANISM="Scrippsiella hangoei-like, Strain SHHI-4" /NCGR_SAMPLE_ID=MMETSP0368 /ASSEMBLY_ACC=CAM_ASM_000363 /LENGTH=71 /DNA_ID=CAMNT_0018851499 /DNA_START=98 /DNA_END=310 /DNA_ORIENTATION=+
MASAAPCMPKCCTISSTPSLPSSSTNLPSQPGTLAAASRRSMGTSISVSGSAPGCAKLSTKGLEISWPFDS